MSALLKLPGKQPLVPTSALGRFVDSLLQMFEDCRGGLTDETLAKGSTQVETFFAELYAREEARLAETIKDSQFQLTPAARSALAREVDAKIKKVVVPEYARLAGRFTERERNDFYLTGEKLHALERILFGVAGILIGTFVIAAPFIPLWSKEWILPFMVLGLFFPNIRRYLAIRRYERDLNRLVTRADRELSRIDLAYLTSGETIAEMAPPEPVEEEKQDGSGQGQA